MFIIIVIMVLGFSLLLDCWGLMFGGFVGGKDKVGGGGGGCNGG